MELCCSGMAGRFSF